MGAEGMFMSLEETVFQICDCAKEGLFWMGLVDLHYCGFYGFLNV